MAFAVPTDVTNAMEGLSPPLPSEPRIQRELDVVQARLRILIPDLEARIVAVDLALGPEQQNDLAILTRDVVVQAVKRRLGPSGPEAQSTTQQAGPFATTVRFRQDKSGMFSDDDLNLLHGYFGTDVGPIGTIRLGMVDWANQ